MKQWQHGMFCSQAATQEAYGLLPSPWRPARRPHAGITALAPSSGNSKAALMRDVCTTWPPIIAGDGSETA